jgi:hypothetical protein
VRKVKTIQGDVSEEGLGMSKEDTEMLRSL